MKTLGPIAAATSSLGLWMIAPTASLWQIAVVVGSAGVAGWSAARLGR